VLFDKREISITAVSILILCLGSKRGDLQVEHILQATFSLSSSLHTVEINVDSRIASPI
jgi:hypothetical protein